MVPPTSGVANGANVGADGFALVDGEGDADDAALGDVVGAALGDAEVAIDGAADAVEPAEAVGLAVGVGEGVGLGVKVGLAVGVGEGVGDSVGDGVGDGVGGGGMNTDWTTYTGTVVPGAANCPVNLQFPMVVGPRLAVFVRFATALTNESTAPFAPAHASLCISIIQARLVASSGSWPVVAHVSRVASCPDLGVTLASQRGWNRLAGAVHFTSLADDVQVMLYGEPVASVTMLRTVAASTAPTPTVARRANTTTAPAIRDGAA
ncbi:MAG: hypothetical protein ABI620_01325 [Chloroflexota bacterium]